jgi:hypothetical protein
VQTCRLSILPRRPPRAEPDSDIRPSRWMCVWVDAARGQTILLSDYATNRVSLHTSEYTPGAIRNARAMRKAGW